MCFHVENLFKQWRRVYYLKKQVTCQLLSQRGSITIHYYHYRKCLQLVRKLLFGQFVISVCPVLLLNISSIIWLFPPLSASHPTLFSPHMGFTFGFTEHFLNAILRYIIWSHSLPVTTSHVDASWVSQAEAVTYCPGELWPFNLTLFRSGDHLQRLKV